MEDVDVFYRNYQMYTLMYELLRFYLPKNALGPRSLPKEVFDWNHCVAYTIESSVKNPTNLLLYIACMSHQMIVAQQQCLASPKPWEPPFAPPSRTTTLSAVNVLQTRTSEISSMAIAQLTASDAQIAIASVDPGGSLMLPLPYSRRLGTLSLDRLCTRRREHRLNIANELIADTILTFSSLTLCF